jgi:hypothetical protein
MLQTLLCGVGAVAKCAMRRKQPQKVSLILSSRWCFSGGLKVAEKTGTEIADNPTIWRLGIPEINFILEAFYVLFAIVTFG